MDIRMPVMDGLEATRQILGDDGAGEVQVLILTTFDLDEYVYDGAPRRRQRVPAQGHATGRPARRRSAGGRRDALLSPGVTRHLIDGVRPARRPVPVRRAASRADRTGA